ncbi:MAG TPA: patatin-like phospholipase family protein [Chitinophagaceae bacterium]
MIRGSMMILFACCQLLLAAQTKPVITNLVFEGAGIRGVAYCGAINEMESAGMFQHIEKVGGTSAGAIVALTISLGYTAGEIQEIIAGTNFNKFNDGRYFFAGGINRINKYFGWYRGTRIGNWFGEIIHQKTGNADITFEELHQKGFKDLYVTGTCLNKQKLIIFSYETYPKMKVKDAVRISVGIPLYFESVFIDPDGKVIHHPKHKEGLDVMVDGGLIGNFPIRIFDTGANFNFATLGFRIDSDEQIKNDRESKNIAPLPVGNFKQYMTAFYNMVIENLNRQQLRPEDWQRTVSISDGKVGPRLRKLSKEEITTLIGNGRQAMNNFLH